MKTDRPASDKLESAISKIAAKVAEANEQNNKAIALLKQVQEELSDLYISLEENFK